MISCKLPIKTFIRYGPLFPPHFLPSFTDFHAVIMHRPQRNSEWRSMTNPNKRILFRESQSCFCSFSAGHSSRYSCLVFPSLNSNILNISFFQNFWVKNSENFHSIVNIFNTGDSFNRIKYESISKKFPMDSWIQQTYLVSNQITDLHVRFVYNGIGCCLVTSDQLQHLLYFGWFRFFFISTVHSSTWL